MRQIGGGRRRAALRGRTAAESGGRAGRCDARQRRGPMREPVRRARERCAGSPRVRRRTGGDHGRTTVGPTHPLSLRTARSLAERITPPPRKSWPGRPRATRRPRRPWGTRARPEGQYRGRDPVEPRPMRDRPAGAQSNVAEAPEQANRARPTGRSHGRTTGAPIHLIPIRNPFGAPRDRGSRTPALRDAQESYRTHRGI